MAGSGGGSVTCTELSYGWLCRYGLLCRATDGYGSHPAHQYVDPLTAQLVPLAHWQSTFCSQTFHVRAEGNQCLLSELISTFWYEYSGLTRPVEKLTNHSVK